MIRRTTFTLLLTAQAQAQLTDMQSAPQTFDGVNNNMGPYAWLTPYSTASSTMPISSSSKESPCEKNDPRKHPKQPLPKEPSLDIPDRLNLTSTHPASPPAGDWQLSAETGGNFQPKQLAIFTEIRSRA